MAKTGGPRRGAGRPAGTLNRRSVEIVAALSDGLSPIEYMLGIMRDEAADPADRRWAAEKASPFFHPKPAPMQRLVKLDLPAADTAEGVKAAFAKIIQAVADGDLSPAEAQSFAALIDGQRRVIEAADHLERLEALEKAMQIGRGGVR